MRIECVCKRVCVLYNYFIFILLCICDYLYSYIIFMYKFFSSTLKKDERKAEGPSELPVEQGWKGAGEVNVQRTQANQSYQVLQKRAQKWLSICVFICLALKFRSDVRHVRHPGEGTPVGLVLPVDFGGWLCS